jgi:hypothetical protein
MQNDQQSAKQKPLIIHGAIANNNDIAQYGKKVPVLVPFDYYNLKTKIKSIQWKDWWNYLFVDSGAFSVSQGNATIELKKYIRFIKDNEDKISNYASLDVVGDGETSLHNWKIMRKNGLFPIPVFHDGENYDILKEYTDNCSYIGLGAVAYKSNKERLMFFDKVFTMFPDRSKVGFHGFGISNSKIIIRYPWRSVDASTICVASRFGEVIFGQQLFRCTIAIEEDKKDIKMNNNKGEMKNDIIEKEFKKYGWNYEVAKQKSKDGLTERLFFNLDSFSENAKIPNIFNPTVKMNYLF